MIEIRGYTYRELMAELSKFFAEVKELNDRDWHGGYCCIASNRDGMPFLIEGFGHMPEEKAALSLQFCQEKARRLAAHAGHITSFESRNPDENMWGGAIRTGSGPILSFSGLPEKLDEAVMFVLAVRSGHLSMKTASAEAVFSRNDLFEKAFELTRQV